MNAARRAVLSSLACWLATRPGAAWSQADTTPPAIAQRIARATLRGRGSYTWFGLHIYEARLFVGADGLDLDHWTRSEFALELRYSRALKGAAIAQRSIDEMQVLGYGNQSQRDSWLAHMRAIFPDVHEGRTLTGVSKPGTGTEFLFNGESAGVVDDADFGLAFFGIWLDPRTSAKDLRARLLGNGGRK